MIVCVDVVVVVVVHCDVLRTFLGFCVLTSVFLWSKSRTADRLWVTHSQPHTHTHTHTHTTTSRCDEQQQSSLNAHDLRGLHASVNTDVNKISASLLTKTTRILKMLKAISGEAVWCACVCVCVRVCACVCPLLSEGHICVCVSPL